MIELTELSSLEPIIGFEADPARKFHWLCRDLSGSANGRSSKSNGTTYVGTSRVCGSSTALMTAVSMQLSVFVILGMQGDGDVSLHHLQSNVT